MPSWQYVAIGSDSGLVSHRRQAIAHSMMTYFIDAYPYASNCEWKRYMWLNVYRSKHTEL